MVIKILNLERCIKKIEDIEKVDIMPAIIESARAVQKTAKDLAPFDTGILAGSIKVKSYKQQQTAAVYTTTEYAPYQEFGTVKMRAQPFLNPALNINRLKITNLIKNYVREKLKNPNSNLLGGQDDSSSPAVTRDNKPRRTRRNGGYRISEGGKVTKGLIRKK